MIARRINFTLIALMLMPAALLILAATSESRVQAQEAPATISLADTLLQDTNGDGILQVAAFGDSLTRGLGDSIQPGEDVQSGTLLIPESDAGFPLRLEQILGVSVTNLGDPGEFLIPTGITRFSNIILSHHFDVIFFLEGSNDSFNAATASSVLSAYQVAANIARMAGTTPIFLTQPPVCCGHGGLARFIDTYRDQVKHVTVVNGLAMADVNHAFRNTCNVGDCYLLNLPEGLHPNTDGYDIMAEAVLATVYKIDLFSPTGRTDLEAALLLPPGTVQTKPDPIASPPTQNPAPARIDPAADVSQS